MIRPVDSATGMNRSGGTRPRVGECQRSERLDADDGVRVEVDQRLVVDAELAALEAEPKLVLEAEQLAELARHPVLVELVAAAAGLLRRVHGDVRVADQVVARAGGRAWETMPMLAPSVSWWPATATGSDSRSRSRCATPIAAGSSASSSRSANSSPPRRASVSPGRLVVGEAPGDLLQQLVAGVVAERVVHLLEAVEVDQQHADRGRGALRTARAPGRGGRGRARGSRGP